MSAQFINSNNQSLLWKVINNTPQMINYFNNANPGEKEKWFQTIIGHIYKQYNGQNISLKDMNKRTIDFMLQSLMPPQPTGNQPPMGNQYLAPNQQPMGNQYLPPNQQPTGNQYLAPNQSPMPNQYPAPSQYLATNQYPVVKNREQQINEQFTRRQAEYESMVKKEVPTPHFTENVKDEAIVDLNSAVEEYKKQRTQDNQVFIPPSKKLDLKDAENISITVEELPKKVQWGENTEHVFDKNESIADNTRFTNIEKDIAEMKLKLSEILALLQPKN